MRELRVAMDEAHRARDLAALTEACAELCQTLAQHIFKENHVLYPMVEQLARERGLDPDAPRHLAKVTRTH